ncbi:MAG TPA: transcriptional repressor [Gammaproteobacteria bacterium]|nr:transcriptional repressor [Gammaproteobacteria bacterium]
MDKQRIQKTLRRAERLCQQRQARLTRQRRTVFELVCAADKPLSAYEILDRMRAVAPNPAPPTVYRALDFLLQQGLIHKLETLHAYVGCNHPDKPHASQFLICSDCGLVREIENPAIEQGVAEAEQNTGFITRRPVVELLGTCARCASEAD